MGKLIIHHAYDGFLYAPLFLADKLGLLPGNCELVCDGDDATSIQSLCDDESPDKDHWFAVCDPLCKRAETAVPRGGHDERICLAGSFITAAPVWLYNINPNIEPLREEMDLAKYKHEIKKIVTYPENTTGYLFGERIRRQFIPQATVVPVPFGKEFDSIDDQTLIVTSDLLRVLKEDKADQILPADQRKHAIIFRYPERGPEFAKQFLFTGVLTLRSAVLKQNLDVLLCVLGAIQKSVHYLNQEIVDAKHVKVLAKKFEAELSGLGFGTASTREVHVRDALRHMKELRLHNEALLPDPIAFTNAENEWVSQRGGADARH